MIHDDHEDIIKRGIDNRMDLYRLIFLLVQIVALFFLALKVYWRNNELQVKFLRGLRVWISRVPVISGGMCKQLGSILTSFVKAWWHNG